MTFFRTFAGDLFPNQSRLVINCDDALVTLVDAAGAFQEQKSVTPLSLILALPLLEAAPNYALHETLLAAYRDFSREEAHHILTAANTPEARDNVLKPLRTTLYRVRQQFSVFGLTLVAVNELGYRFLAAGMGHRRRVSRPRLLNLSNAEMK